MGRKSSSGGRNIRRTLYIKPEIQEAACQRAESLDLKLSPYVEHLIERDLRRARGEFDFPPSRIHERTMKTITQLELVLLELKKDLDFDS